MARNDLLARVRKFCLSLPNTEESTRLGGEPHFYVGGKIFAGCGDDGAGAQVGMKVGLDLQAILVTRPGFHVAKYVGKHGWISVDAAALADDAELHRLLRISYDLIAGGKARTAAKKPSKPRAKPAGRPRK